MPTQVREKVGEIHRVRVVKTFGDKVKEFVQGLIGVVVILVILGLISG